MLSLIINNNYNILINVNTGRWLGFYYEANKNNVQLWNINKSKLKQIYEKYEKLSEILNLYDELEKRLPIRRDLLTKMNYLVLHTSDACNMRCKYCYAEDNLFNCEANKMPAKVMIDAINKFLIKDDFWVLFHGREPLTNLDAILETVQYFSGYKTVHFILQTNGMLLDEKTIKKFQNLNVKINISIDGFDDYANELRINKHTKNYTAKITNLLKNNKEISPILILHKNNINSISQISDELKKQNHNFVAYNFLWPTAENKSLDKYIVDNETLFKNLVNVFENGIIETETSSRFAFKERDLYLLYGRVVYRHINNYMCNKSPCGAGSVCICVNFNGDVYPCTTVNGQKENYMGNIYKNTKEEILSSDFVLKHRNLNNIEECKTCPFKLFCGGGACSGLLYNYKKNINLKSIYCNYYYNMVLYIMKECINYQKDDIFLNKGGDS